MKCTLHPHHWQLSSWDWNLVQHYIQLFIHASSHWQNKHSFNNSFKQILTFTCLIICKSLVHETPCHHHSHHEPPPPPPPPPPNVTNVHTLVDENTTQSLHFFTINSICSHVFKNIFFSQSSVKVLYKKHLLSHHCQCEHPNPDEHIWTHPHTHCFKGLSIAVSLVSTLSCLQLMYTTMDENKCIQHNW